MAARRSPRKAGAAPAKGTRAPSKKAASPRAKVDRPQAKAKKGAAARAPRIRAVPVGALRAITVDAKKPTAVKRVKIVAERPPAYRPAAALERVVQVLGKSGVAEVIGVSKSQPGRWLSGEERMSERHQAAVLDLDGFLQQVLGTFTPEQAGVWLYSPNSFLGGSTPMDILQTRGFLSVVPAIVGYRQGVYA